MEKCPNCKKVMKLRMYSNNWLMKWYDCKHCGGRFKRGYTEEECNKIGLVTRYKQGNHWYPYLVPA